jgi:single-strand selective monofunctional uracil DNA glycosylase
MSPDQSPPDQSPPDHPLVLAALALSHAVDALVFAPPVHTVYNPLAYAWEPHKAYLTRFGNGPTPVVFLGMNPGPFGMSQTGVPFGDPSMVRDYLRLSGEVNQPATVHPKRPIHGIGSKRGEVSGRRLWGAIRDRWPQPDAFFDQHFVANYCPVAFMEESGRNRTPDKLPKAEREALFALCDAHLARLVVSLEAQWLIGVGRFAEKQARKALEGLPVRIGSILHPSPASPAANRDWIGTVSRQLDNMGIWPTH